MLHPDYLLFGGDLVTYTECYPAAMRMMAELRAPGGCFAVPGNWDKRRRRWLPFREIERRYEQAGWRLLVNEEVRDDALLIYGTDDYKIGIPRVYDTRAKTGFRVLLSHNPDTVAELPEKALPNMIYPVVATLSGDNGRIAVAHLATMLYFDPVRHTILLTDNADNNSEVAPIAIRTGAEYRILTPEPLKENQQIRDPRDPGATGGKPALFQGVIGDWNQPADVLFVNLPEATVEVDLKSVYRLEHLELGAGSKPNLKGAEISFSRDGKNFSAPKKLDVAGLKLELMEFELPKGVEARYVRLRLQFSAPEATFGEIKLLGRTLDNGEEK